MEQIHVTFSCEYDEGHAVIRNDKIIECYAIHHDDEDMPYTIDLTADDYFDEINEAYYDETGRYLSEEPNDFGGYPDFLSGLKSSYY